MDPKLILKSYASTYFCNSYNPKVSWKLLLQFGTQFGCHKFFPLQTEYMINRTRDKYIPKRHLRMLASQQAWALQQGSTVIAVTH
jgi:hypothetical protein